MRIIFSRKGFETEHGGCPSPVIGRLPVSLPIPDDSEHAKVRYSDLMIGKVDIGKTVEDLTKRKVKGEDSCHNDPELDRTGIFGQSGNAQGYLSRRKAGAGDLFLFYGLFREARQTDKGYQFVPNKPMHLRLHGWLEPKYTKRFPGRRGEQYAYRYPQYKNNPHFVGSWWEGNVVYFPTDYLSFISNEQIPGFGRFRADHPDALLGVGENVLPGRWRLPDWFRFRRGKRLVYDANGKEWGATLSNPSKPQELIAEVLPEHADNLQEWLEGLFQRRYIW